MTAFETTRPCVRRKMNSPFRNARKAKTPFPFAPAGLTATSVITRYSGQDLELATAQEPAIGLRIIRAFSIGNRPGCSDVRPT